MELYIKKIVKDFGSYDDPSNRVRAVDRVDLHVKEGELITLLGPSGCGKTTLLRMIAGFEDPTEGDVFFGDRRVNDVAPNHRNATMVFQSYAIFPHLNVYENIAFGLRLKKMEESKIREKMEGVIDLVGLTGLESRQPSQLSGGQQQRVALARAIIMEPALLLFDEPLSNLDAKLREQMRIEIRHLQKRLGITSVYVTHDQAEAMAMSNRVVVMSKGLVQQIGEPHDIYSNPANKMVADFIGLVNFLPGEVADGRIRIAGMATSFPNTSNLTGEVTIAVRPENITLSKDNGTMPGMLTHRFYLGDSVDYRVQVGEELVRVIVKGADLKQFKDGEKVFLDFEKILVFDKE